MHKVLIIGAGGVGRVVAHQCARYPEIFSHILLASRRIENCHSIAKEITEKYAVHMATSSLDAHDVSATVALINSFQADVVIHVALPYQDLAIMEACLATGTHYVDTANYEPIEEAKFSYDWQWNYHERFQEKGLTALLGCGFDPGVTNVFTAYAAKHYFDEIHTLDIVDCNAGDHGKAFATNFNPEINIREITQKGKYYENGEWHYIAPHSICKPLTYPNIGVRDSYLIYHEELESLVKHYPTLRSARFWMTFSKEYLTHLRVIQNIGMANITPVHYKGQDIVPLQFLKAVLPVPADLAENYTGETSIGCRLTGVKNGEPANCYLYNNCSHETSYQKTFSQAVSFTTGVSATLGTQLLLEGVWKKPGVYNVEQFNPDPFLEKLPHHGLPWHVQHNISWEMHA